jgi:folate-dependent phosphoribosylglycinamide formyltransferase PurN
MATKRLYDSSNGTMQVAGLMSGSGTNLKKIIEKELELSKGYSYPYHVAVIFTDNAESNALAIGMQYDIPVVVHDIKAFYKKRGASRKDLKVREEYDAVTIKALRGFGVSLLAYAGYMSIATVPLIKTFLGVNVHPADLSIRNEDGTRKYTGDHAVRDAIIAGEKYICSSTHIIEDRVDYGRILMISKPLEVVLEKGFDARNSEMVKAAENFNQNRLKEAGDWQIFPRTIVDIARGRYSQDGFGKLYYDDTLLFNGVRLGEKKDIIQE